MPPKTVTISILGKDYQVHCGADEVQALQRSAAYLDDRMGEMKARASHIGLEKLAVMAALNIANELLALEDASGKQQAQKAQKAQVTRLAKKLDTALNRLKDGLD